MAVYRPEYEGVRQVKRRELRFILMGENLMLRPACVVIGVLTMLY